MSHCLNAQQTAGCNFPPQQLSSHKMLKHQLSLNNALFHCRILEQQMEKMSYRMPSLTPLVMDIFAWVTWDVSTDLRCSLMFGMDFSARHTATHGWSTVNQHHLATAPSLTWSRLRRFQTWAFAVWSCPTATQSEGADQERAALSAYASFIIPVV